MSGVFAAKAAKLAHFQTVGVILFVLHGVVVALLALCAGKCNFDSQGKLPPITVLYQTDTGPGCRFFAQKNKPFAGNVHYTISLPQGQYSFEIFRETKHRIYS